MFLLAMALASADPTQDVGPLLFLDIRYGEHEEAVRVRHPMKKVPLFGGWYMTEKYNITPTCLAVPTLNLKRKLRTVESVSVSTRCPDETLLVLSQKYGPPTLAGEEHYNRTTDWYGRNLAVRVERALNPAQTRINYVWMADGLMIRLETDTGNPISPALVTYSVGTGDTVL